MKRIPKTTKRNKKGTSKRRSKKLRRLSTTRSTAGPGFDFEDQVAAWLLLKALTGQPIPGVEGNAIRLQMQTETLGWVIDDILVTTVAIAPDDARNLAISCKSNVQVTASGFPAEFVTRCWQQWANVESNPMRRGKDCLMLVTRGRNNAFMATWSEIKNAAGGADLALALGRMRATAKHQRMFESVKGPAKNANVTIGDADVVAMIDLMAITPLDFHIAESECEKLAIAQARGLLTNGSLAEGKRLWRELVAQARATRLGSGTLEISDLWRRLRSEFALKDQPDYEASWQTIRALTQDHKATIETALPSDLTLDRKGETDKLLEMVSSDTVCVVFGESGSGKSALVKAMLDQRCPTAAQVWLGPDNLNFALNEATRAALGISQPLINVLDRTAHDENFLVLDAAERLSHASAMKAKALIDELTKRSAVSAKPAWRVLIIGQTEAWIGGTLQELAGAASQRNFEVEELPEATVRDVLRSIPGLGWLATYSDAVSALTNLRTLAWVVQAAARFQGQDGSGALSLTAIVDRLWGYWTNNKPSVQRLLVRLAEREAAFEHSFAVSQLDSGDAATLDDLPIACPLRRDEATGRIRFQHDLAADWTRFQRLKEIAADTRQWTSFAVNPFWHAALRMLGQLLLRQQVGSRSAWDVAFEAAEQNRETAPLADDVLLDALFLDPNADAFLDARADMLLAHGGTRLLRLVKRFEHVASVPGGSVDMQGPFRDLGLYIEAHFRTPIFGRWPAIARFLVKHRDRIAKMTSPAIASLCDRWLTSTPPRLPNGAVTPFRREFAELALASAREMQLAHAKGVIYVGESERLIYQAALTGALDLPADVSEWALEMAQRRPYRADIVERVQVHRAEQTAEHKRRLETDPAYRERHERRRSLPTSISFGRKLPPWPIGPKRRIEGRFREAVLRTGGFQVLMRASPSVAGEVLLACIIEDEPEQDFGSRHDAEHELGIKSDGEEYPTAPWKSPFYAFFHINPDAALSSFHQLIDFCTERLAQAVRNRYGSEPLTLSLRLADGTTRQYAGNYWVFNWSHQNSLFIGQLYCALAALERWLCDLIDAQVDVTPRIDALLRATKSVSVLGVLVNVAKYNEALLKGPLRPLLRVQQLYGWDWQRAKDNAYAFDAMTWARSGEVVFEMAKNWTLAPYRKRTLRQIVPHMILADRDLGDFLVAAASQWVPPNAEKEELEFKIMVAELDYRNYSPVVDSATGKEVITFAYPPDVAALRAPDWLALNAEVQRRAQSIVDAAINGIPDAWEGYGPRILTAPSHLEFIAYFAVQRWIAAPSKDSDERVLRLMTCGDEAAVRVLFWMAYQSRDTLGQRWWRLLYLALLWSGLSMLRPRYGDEQGEDIRWQEWRHWIRTRSLFVGNTTAASINPLAVAKRVERLELERWRRRYAREGRRFIMKPGRRLSGSLDTHFLQNAIAWLFFGNQPDRVLSPEELETHQQLASKFWAHQVWWQLGSGGDEKDDYEPIGAFGHAILDELAHLIIEIPDAAAPTLWRAIFTLGPKGHYAIGYFLTCWFAQITETTAAAEFGSRWRPMIEFMVLDEGWAQGGPWYYAQRLERQVLAFGASDHLKRAPDHGSLVAMMRDLFEVWAKKRLVSDEDNVAGFCGFLATEAGKPLRMDGLQWIAEAMKAIPELGKWFRDYTSTAFMGYLDTLVSEHAPELARDHEARRALFDLVAHAVSRQLTAALALQERIRRLS